jgi:hypothetical protein
MSVRPKSLQDLMLAPVAISVDANLRRLRDRTVDEVLYELALQLDRSRLADERSGREQLILDAATRWVDLHGWHAELTEDATRLRLTDGSVSIDLGLSASIERFIVDGASVALGDHER